MTPVFTPDRRRVRFLLFLVFFLFLSYSYFRGSETLPMRISRYFESQRIFSQEKVYLHTDKSAYVSGDTLFFKGYLLDAMTHIDSVGSNFLYVEFLDRRDSVLLRRKFKRDSGIFRGQFELPVTLQPGDYYLRSYTEWMRNFSPAYFFTKTIPIGNSVVTDIVPKVDYVTNEDGSRVMKIGFFNGEGVPYSEEKVSYSLTDKTGKIYRTRTERTNGSGVLYVRLDERSQITDDPRVDVTFDGEKYDYSRSFYVSSDDEDYKMTFFPEGGNLLLGQKQQVAFKAQNSRGFGESVTGFVVSSEGDTVSRIVTHHDGMGSFLMHTEPGESYRAVVRSSKGREQEFPLPSPVSSGYSLSVRSGRDKLYYQVHKTADRTLDSLYLLCHTRGIPKILLTLTPETDSGAIDNSIFPDGISELLLLDGRGMSLSKRLVFFYRPDVVFSHRTDRAGYGPRERVEMEIMIQDNQGQGLPGDYSLSITDGGSVPIDSLSDHIVSSLLLTSDLKGYIDDPALYFRDNTPETLHSRDLLMMTHGWSRFVTDNLSEAQRQDIHFFKEGGQFVTGHIENLIGGRSKNAMVIGAWWDSDSIMRFRPPVMADSMGNYIIEGMDFVDTARVMIQGRTGKRQWDNVGVVVDSTDYPAPYSKVRYRDTYELLTENYLQQFREDYYNKGGIKVLSLKEITVTGRKLFSEKRGMDSEIFGPEEFRKDNEHSLFYTIKAMPYVQWRPPIGGGEEYFIYKGKPIGYYIVDNFNVSCTYFRNVDISCVASIEFIKDLSMATFPGMSSPPRKGTAIFVRIYPDKFKQLLKVSPGLSLFRIMGYTRPQEFYEPVYDTPERKSVKRPDLRTTIAWRPKVNVDSSGTTQVIFYTSDSPENYNIVLEGVTNQGNPVRYATKLAE